MSMSTTQLAERYGCVSMTLEMPFKDNFDLPDEVYGWSPQRSKYLAFACLDALHALFRTSRRRKPRAPGEAREGHRLMPTLVLLRHGQSQWNLENRFTGWWDVDLSDQGIAEARAAGQLMTSKGVDFDCCFTSVLTRAIRTLHLALHEMDRLWLPVTKDWRLNERHYGGLTGFNKQEMTDKVGASQVKIWRRSFDIPPPPLDAGSEYDVSRDRRYAGIDVPRTESLKDTIARAVPYYEARSRPRSRPASACLSPRMATACAGSSNISRTSATTTSSASRSRPAGRSSMRSPTICRWSRATIWTKPDRLARVAKNQPSVDCRVAQSLACLAAAALRRYIASSARSMTASGGVERIDHPDPDRHAQGQRLAVVDDLASRNLLDQARRPFRAPRPRRSFRAGSRTRRRRSAPPRRCGGRL